MLGMIGEDVTVHTAGRSPALEKDSKKEPRDFDNGVGVAEE